MAATPHNRSAQSLGRKVEPSRRMPLISSSLTAEAVMRGRTKGEGRQQRTLPASRVGGAWISRKAARSLVSAVPIRGLIGLADTSERLARPMGGSHPLRQREMQSQSNFALWKNPSEGALQLPSQLLSPCCGRHGLTAAIFS